MGKFAENTNVSVDTTLTDIRKVIRRYDASNFAVAEEGDRVGVIFTIGGRRVRFTVPLPDRNERIKVKVNTYSTTMRVRTPDQLDQATRQVWRALFLVIKAKLESVESGIETFDQSFMAQLVLPSGETVGAWMAPQIVKAYELNEMPPLLPAGK